MHQYLNIYHSVHSINIKNLYTAMQMCARRCTVCKCMNTQYFRKCTKNIFICAQRTFYFAHKECLFLCTKNFLFSAQRMFVFVHEYSIIHFRIRWTRTLYQSVNHKPTRKISHSQFVVDMYFILLFSLFFSFFFFPLDYAKLRDKTNKSHTMQST